MKISLNATFSYDPWGRMRNPNNWKQYDASTNFPLTLDMFAILERGFTGHEHLFEYDLINMNGRVYDVVLGQFIQADNYVQMPELAGGFNRFTYAGNNPLVQ